MILILKDGSNGEDKSCTLKCDDCGKIYKVTYSQVKRIKRNHHSCSLACRKDWEKDITHHPAWQGGEVKMLGYVFIKTIGHPYGNELGYVKRSRLVMEEYLGRYLLPDEVVHHINFDREDDSLENLMHFENNSGHVKYHAKVRRQLREDDQLVLVGI